MQTWGVALVVVLLAAAHAAQAQPRDEPHTAAAANAYQRGTALAGRGDHAGAITAYEAALQLDPKWLAVRNDLGVELYLNGAPERAVKELRAVLEAEPGRGAVHTNLGFALYDLGRTDDAVAEFRQALDRGARVADTYAGLALGLNKQGHTEEALQTYRAAIERDQNYGRLDYLQGGAAGWSRRAIDDAAPLLRAAAATTPTPKR